MPFIAGVVLGLVTGFGLACLLGLALEEDVEDAPRVTNGRHVNAAIYQIKGR